MPVWQGPLVWRDVVKALNHHVRRSHGSGAVLSLLRGVAVYSREYARLAFQVVTYRQSNSDSAVTTRRFTYTLILDRPGEYSQQDFEDVP